MTNIEQPALPGCGIFRFHMAVEGCDEHLQEGKYIIFLNIPKVNYGERCESAKNDAVQQHGRRLSAYVFALRTRPFGLTKARYPVKYLFVTPC
ncbi:hypothetical protein [Cloacibacillus porcorum]|uniref:hypothetical protein n=1 Tax=Cloacibacillus porcorum TaxID=1197717 RepID=UPI0023F07DF2|nr:hypothetical protein [Cloacibacillus porcorum]